MTDKRRDEILEILNTKEGPITGSELAKRFEVSRQVIVQDIAVLRAQGINIMASSNGYYIPTPNYNSNNIATIVCKHEGYQSIKDELTVIVDMGGKILDVIVMHPVYGEIRCPLMIDSRYELEKFITKVKEERAEPLASLTGGEHIHTIEVPNSKVLDIIKEKLDEKGILVRDC